MSCCVTYQINNYFDCTIVPEEILDETNQDWKEIKTPIRVQELQQLLQQTKYDKEKSRYLIDGFKNGFDIGYRGPTDRRDLSQNLPFRVGTPTDLWNKVMKEVKEGRYAGPFEFPPGEFFIQSPLGLVPKAGNKLWLIFHLSYDFGPEEHRKSINHHTPTELCKVRYNDLDHAVKNSLKVIQLLKNCGNTPIYYAKSDCSNAFRIAPIRPDQRLFLCMRADHPITKKIWYFVDKCLPFCSSISCAVFQSFSDALRHITEAKLTAILIYPAITNYLDDFLFIAISVNICNGIVDKFLYICQVINCPISMDKTEWATQLIVFLGVLLNGSSRTLAIPIEKKIKALDLLQTTIDKRKVTIKFVQKLTGTLNFLNRVIVPGRTFTREMYSKLKITNSKTGERLKDYHHVHLNKEFIQDCKIAL